MRQSLPCSIYKREVIAMRKRLRCDMPGKMASTIGMLNLTKRATIWPQLARRKSGHSLKLPGKAWHYRPHTRGFFAHCHPIAGGDVTGGRSIGRPCKLASDWASHRAGGRCAEGSDFARFCPIFAQSVGVAAFLAILADFSPKCRGCGMKCRGFVTKCTGCQIYKVYGLRPKV